jgi:hypothetical protein
VEKGKELGMEGITFRAPESLNERGRQRWTNILQFYRSKIRQRPSLFPLESDTYALSKLLRNGKCLR